MSKTSKQTVASRWKCEVFGDTYCVTTSEDDKWWASSPEGFLDFKLNEEARMNAVGHISGYPAPHWKLISKWVEDKSPELKLIEGPGWADPPFVPPIDKRPISIITADELTLEKET